MKNSKFSFVILHYIAIEDTIKCVDSILANCISDFQIVIVDNASPNNSGVVLERKYKDNTNIHVILNSKNIGFSRGNNVGFHYAKTILNPDFIILCNNDTLLLESTFCKKVIEEYNTSQFSVLGPKIYLKNNEVNNLKINLPSITNEKKLIIKLKIKYLFYCGHLQFIYQMVKGKIIGKSMDSANNSNVNCRHENIVLHGCFWIFSKEYFNKFDGLDDSTFLYCEEELLYIRLEKNRLLSVYNPEIKILHNEDAATNAMAKTNRKKQLFVCKHLIKSNKILLRKMREK